MIARCFPVAIVAVLCGQAPLCHGTEGHSFLGRTPLCLRRRALFISPQISHRLAAAAFNPLIGRRHDAQNLSLGSGERRVAEEPEPGVGEDGRPLPTLTLTSVIEVCDEQQENGDKEQKEVMDERIGGFAPPVFVKEGDESAFIKNTLMTNVMFQSLSDKTLDELVLAFEKAEIDKKSDIITQGDPNVDYCYVLGKGECSVIINKKRLPYPYGSLKEGTVFGELGMLYDAPRAATVAAETACTVYRVDRKTFRFFFDRQKPAEIEDVKAELRVIDKVIDKIAGVETRYDDGSIIQQYKPQRSWLWKRWTGTVLQNSYKFSLFNMAVAAAISFVIGHRSDCTWPLAVAPHQSNIIISRMAAFGKHWRYLQSISTFILTFFLSQAYSVWREVYSAGRKVQGRLNDIGLMLASTAARDGTGRYTPEAGKLLDDVGCYTRLFHAFMWANFAKNYKVLLSLRGMSRMLSRGLMTQTQFNTLQNIDQRAGANNACLEWIIIRTLKGVEDGHLKDPDGSMRYVLLDKCSALRGVMGGIGDTLDGKIPLAYTHIVQILVDTFLFMAPVALYAELGIWSILCVGLLTLFYSGLLDLAKTFLDPLDNDDFCNDSINMDIGVLIRESNGGSTRWKNGAAILPF